MNKQDNGGPAFPELDGPHGWSLEKGMTLRDYFAGRALSGLCANSHEDVCGLTYQEQADYCWEMADAMLKGRKS